MDHYMRFGYSPSNSTMDYWVRNPPTIMSSNYNCSINSIMIICDWIYFIMQSLCYLPTTSAKSLSIIMQLTSILSNQHNYYQGTNFTEPSEHSLFILSVSLLTDLRSMYLKDRFNYTYLTLRFWLLLAFCW